MSEPIAPGPPCEDRYALGALLGRGGMGAVYAARDNMLGRDVALKELQPQLSASATARERLAREAAITSRLDHPGIIGVHDRGHLPDGRPFFTMRLVRGRTLAVALAEAPTAETRRDLVRHLLVAAEAVASAHDAGVVHRDLKPANILIGAHGETQVVDWGLATPTAAAAARWVGLPGRAAEGAVGTAPYMAPEQARGEPPDPRHDVWSLGVTLAQVVGEETSPEMAAIVGRATAGSVAERYPDAGAFAADLLRWFEGRRVAAYRYTPGDLLRRTLRAWRLPLALGAAALGLLAVSVAIGWWQTTRSLDRALVAEADAREALADLRLEQAVAATRAGARERAERLALGVLSERDDPAARGVFAAYGRSERPVLLGEGLGPSCGWSALPEGASDRWVLCGTPAAVTRWEDGAVVWTVETVAVGGDVRGDAVLVWDVAGHTTELDAVTGQVRAKHGFEYLDWTPVISPRLVLGGPPAVGIPGVPSGCVGRIQAASVSSAGRIAVVCSDGTLILGTQAEPTQVRVATDVRDEHVAFSLAWTEDNRLVVGALRGRVFVFDGDDGALLASGATDLGEIESLAISPDGRHAALGGTLGGIGIWSLDTASLVGEVPAARPRAFAFVSEGIRVHEGGASPRVRTWRLPGGAPAVVRGTAGLADLAVSPDGARLATAGGDGSVVTVNLRDGGARRVRLGDAVVKSVIFEPGGTALLASGIAAPFLQRDDGSGVPRPLPGARPLRRLAWLPGGRILGVDLHAGLYRWADATASPERLAPTRSFIDLEVDGSSVVTLDALGNVDRVEGDVFTPLTTEPDARAVALRGDRLVVAFADRVVIRDGRGTRRIAAPAASLLDVALSADGSRVAAGSLDGLVRVWDAATGALLGELPGHTERAVAVEFLPDGDLASASWDKSARVWDLGALDRPVSELEAEVVAGWGPPRE